MKARASNAPSSVAVGRQFDVKIKANKMQRSSRICAAKHDQGISINTIARHRETQPPHLPTQAPDSHDVKIISSRPNQDSMLHYKTAGNLRDVLNKASKSSSIEASHVEPKLGASNSSDDVKNGLQRYYSILKKQHDCLDISKKFEDGLTTISIRPQEPVALVGNRRAFLQPVMQSQHPSQMSTVININA